MKLLRLVPVLFLAVLICLSGSTPATALTVPGSSEGILGINPSFPYGYWTDQFGTWGKYVVDSTAGAPAIAGKLIVYSPTTANWKQNTVATVALPTGLYGVVITPAPAVGGQAYIQVRGQINALCTTTGTAIALGNTLAADAAGNLTYVTTPAVGTALAIAFGTLTTSQPATSVSVYLGGY